MVTLPRRKLALRYKWVYNIKFHADGYVERLKARLVILGNHQVVGLNYNNFFALVAKITIVHLLLAVDVAKNYERH